MASYDHTCCVHEIKLGQVHSDQWEMEYVHDFTKCIISLKTMVTINNEHAPLY